MDLGLIIEPQSAFALRASYSCPCGCRPEVSYERAATPAIDTCCCGNQFAVGVAAEDHLTRRESFAMLTDRFEAPWGDAISVAWAIGPSTHAIENADEHGEQASDAQRPAPGDLTGPAADPVCGMTVDPEAARARGLHSAYRGQDYFFCGKGCKLEFDDDPGHFLDAAYVPSM